MNPSVLQTVAGLVAGPVGWVPALAAVAVLVVLDLRRVAAAPDGSRWLARPASRRAAVGRYLVAALVVVAFALLAVRLLTIGM